jgi:hypothetical protein
MPARQTRRSTSRRRVAPGPTLPRPAAAEVAKSGPAAAAAIAEVPVAKGRTRRPLGVRAHHVSADYRYVRTDLIAVTVVSVAAIAFVVGMSFVL